MPCIALPPTTAGIPSHTQTRFDFPVHCLDFLLTHLPPEALLHVRVTEFEMASIGTYAKNTIPKTKYTTNIVSAANTNLGDRLFIDNGTLQMLQNGSEVRPTDINTANTSKIFLLYIPKLLRVNKVHNKFLCRQYEAALHTVSITGHPARVSSR